MQQRETFILKLLRFREKTGWRSTLSLRNIRSEESHTFASAKELVEFLEHWDAGRNGEQQHSLDDHS